MPEFLGGGCLRTMTAKVEQANVVRFGFFEILKVFDDIGFGCLAIGQGFYFQLDVTVLEIFR